MKHDSDNEHSGLHDIRELARSAKQRISRRKTTETEAQDAILASSTALRLVALPDKDAVLPDPPPRKRISRGTVPEPVAKPNPVQAKEPVVSAPEAEANLRRRTPAATPDATPTPKAAVLAPEAGPSKSKLPLIIAAVAVVALGVGAFVMMGGDKGEDNVQAANTTDTNTGTPANQVAGQSSQMSVKPLSADNGTSGDDTIGAGVPDEATVDQGTDDATSDKGTDTEAVGEPLEVKVNVAANPTEKEKEKKALADASRDDATKALLAKERARKEAEKKAAAAVAAKAKTDKTDKTDKEKTEPKVEDKGDKTKAAPPADDLDALISEATGGSDITKGKKKVEDKGPSKKKITLSDVRSHMGKIGGKVKGCYARFKEPGTVKVRFTIAPTGSITRATPKGSFSGTDTGKCVAHHVKKVKFPAFAGRPQSFTWPFLLQ